MSPSHKKSKFLDIHVVGGSIGVGIGHYCHCEWVISIVVFPIHAHRSIHIHSYAFLGCTQPQIIKNKKMSPPYVPCLGDPGSFPQGRDQEETRFCRKKIVRKNQSKISHVGRGDSKCEN